MQLHSLDFVEPYFKEYAAKYLSESEKRYVLDVEYMRNCAFLYPNLGQDLVHPGKCRGQQVVDQLVIKLYAIRMAHRTNLYILRIINERRASTKSLEERFNRLKTRSYNGCTFKILFHLLISEFPEVDKAGRPFRHYAQSFLSEVAPRIELRLLKYRNTGNDQPLRCGNCSICQQTEDEVVFETEQELESYFCFQFRTYFYDTLITFILGVRPFEAE